MNLREPMRIVIGAAVCLAALLSGMTAGRAGAAFEYRSVPFAVGGEPTLLAAAEPFLGGRLRGLWVGRRGALSVVDQRPDGAMEVVESVALPPDVVPIAVDDSSRWTFVLDAAGAVLVIARSFGKPDRHVATLATGSQPSAMVVGDEFLAVANAGSDDLSIYTWSTDGQFSAERRVPVGSRPRTLLAGDFLNSGEFLRGEELAVANEGSGTVTFLGRRPDFTARAELRVGGAPAALAPVDAGNRVGLADMAVGDATAPRVTLWRTTGRGLTSAGAVALATPASRAHALFAADLDDDQRADLVIGDRSTGTVAVAQERRGKRAFDPARTRLSGLDPVGLLVGDIGGDWHDDIAVIDRRTQTVIRQLTPGDALVVPEPAAENLDAGDGRLAWSRPGAAGRHRLVVRSRKRPVEIPGTTSDVALTPRFGRLRSERAAVGYVACRGARCQAYAWDFQNRRARPIKIASPPGCQVRDVAVWDQWTAYALGQIGKRRCPARHRGLWVKRRGSRPRKSRGHDTKLGDLRNGYLAWQTTKNPGRDSVVTSLRLRRLGSGVTGVLDDQFGIDSLRGLGSSQISGRYVYWTHTGEGVGEAFRARLAGRRPCAQSFPRDRFARGLPGMPVGDGSFAADFGVDRGRLLYADDFSIFRVDSARLRWSRGRCR